MDIAAKLGLGMAYSDRGKTIAFVVSFLISGFLRAVPVLMAIHHGDSWLALKFFPFWIGFDLLLISFFAFWGFLGVGLSCVVASMFISPTTIHPAVEVTFILLALLFLVATFQSNWFQNRIEDSKTSYLLSVMCPCMVGFSISSALSVLIGLEGLQTQLELVGMLAQVLSAVLITGYPSLVVLTDRRFNPRGWTSEWFILLFGEDGYQCYPASAPLLPLQPVSDYYQVPSQYPSRIQMNQPMQHTSPYSNEPSRPNQDLVTLTSNGEVICTRCGTNNWPSRNRCRSCRSQLY